MLAQAPAHRSASAAHTLHPLHDGFAVHDWNVNRFSIVFDELFLGRASCRSATRRGPRPWSLVTRPAWPPSPLLEWEHADGCVWTLEVSSDGRASVLGRTHGEFAGCVCFAVSGHIRSTRLLRPIT